MIFSFPFVKQLDSQDCGFACLRTVAKYYGKDISPHNEVFSFANISKQGISFIELIRISEKLGFNNLLLKVNFDDISKKINLPAIFFWKNDHFIVVYKISKKFVYVADPAFGKIKYTKEEFIKNWTYGENEGVILLIEPTNQLFELEPPKSHAVNFRYIIKYLTRYKKQISLVALTLFISSIIELIFPFFTQKIIDKGVILHDISFIYLVLIAQIFVFISRISLSFYRSWLFIHISSRVNLSMISDFLIKLMKLPLSYFNSKNIGDITKRIEDHERIENFLSQELVQTAFSIFSIMIYAFILIYFNFTIFLIVFFPLWLSYYGFLNF